MACVQHALLNTKRPRELIATAVCRRCCRVCARRIVAGHNGSRMGLLSGAQCLGMGGPARPALWRSFQHDNDESGDRVIPRNTHFLIYYNIELSLRNACSTLRLIRNGFVV